MRKKSEKYINKNIELWLLCFNVFSVFNVHILRTDRWIKVTEYGDNTTLGSCSLSVESESGLQPSPPLFTASSSNRVDKEHLAQEGDSKSDPTTHTMTVCQHPSTSYKSRNVYQDRPNSPFPVLSVAITLLPGLKGHVGGRLTQKISNKKVIFLEHK